MRAVGGTPFDLRKPVVIGPRLKELPGPGFDHNFCLSLPGDAWTEKHAARFNSSISSQKYIKYYTSTIGFHVLHSNILVYVRVYHPASGRVLEVSTSQPGIQLYTANFLDGSLVGKDGVRYNKHSSFCLETQNWPDAVNQVRK